MSTIMPGLSTPPWFDQDFSVPSDEQIGVDCQIGTPSFVADPFDILNGVLLANTRSAYGGFTGRKPTQTAFDVIFNSPHLFIPSIDVSGFQRFALHFRDLFKGLSDAANSKSSIFLLNYFARLQHSLPFPELQRIISDPLHRDLPFLPPPPRLERPTPPAESLPTYAAPWQIFAGMRISDSRLPQTGSSTQTPQIAKINGLGCFPAFGDNYGDVSMEEDESDDDDDSMGQVTNDDDTDYMPVRISKRSPRSAAAPKASESRLAPRSKGTGKAEALLLKASSSGRRDRKVTKVLEASSVPNTAAELNENDENSTETDNRYRPYPCPIVGCQHRSFTSPELEKHELTHGDKQWFCQGCAGWFIRGDSLKRHFETTRRPRCIAYGGSREWTSQMKNFKVSSAV